jgi:hypothetical protein
MEFALTQLPGPFKRAWDRLMPGDLAEKFDMKSATYNVLEITRISQFSPYMVSDFSAYMEVVVIDGGEWLKGAGQFNMLEAIPEELWDQLEMMIKAKKNK